MTDNDNQFSVGWYDPDGNYHKELEWVSAADAVRMAHSLSKRPAVQLGVITRIMVTDADDFCCFLWEGGKVIYPKQHDILQSAARHDH